MSDTPFLRTEGVSKIYKGAQPAGLKPTDLTIGQGSITAIAGASGSGKTTLLHLLFGLLTPDGGSVEFKGEHVLGPEEKLIPGHNAMKLVAQQTDDLNQFAKVYDNISVLLPNTDVETKHARTTELIQQLNLESIARSRIADLSGGERQRVAIARALAKQPEVLLFDEPFNQVDTSFREGLQQDIRRIVKEQNLTVIIVSHDPAEVLSMADELIILKDGEIIEQGPPRELYNNPLHLYTARLLSNCNVISRRQAMVFDIKTDKENVVIYPEWTATMPAYTDDFWTVEKILFKGFYEELALVKAGVAIRVWNAHEGRYGEGDHVQLKIRRWLEF